MVKHRPIITTIKRCGLYAMSLCACLEILSGCATLDIFNQSSPTEDSPKTEKLVFEIPETASKANSQITFNQQYPDKAPSYSLPKPRLEVNNEVRKELASYLKNNASCISQHLERQESLYPVLSKIFHDEGLPEEMLNLALIESGFRPEATSPAGAVGIWQFMSSTARLYGLKVNKKVDERRDPILSTLAAARHLKDLYAKYNDWFLVLAAYNAGDGAISKAISNKQRMDYWTLSRSGKINPETARFVPKFIAASILQKIYHNYGSGIQFAQYIDKHIVPVSNDDRKIRYAFYLDNRSDIKLG